MIKQTPAQSVINSFKAEETISSHIPYAYLIDSKTIETKSGHILQVLKFEGISAETMPDLQIDAEKSIRESLLRGISDSSISLYFHTIKSKTEVSLNSSFVNKFSSQLNQKWMERLNSNELFKLDHFITVVKKPPVGKTRRLADIFRSVSSKINQSARESFRKKSQFEINKTTKRLLGSLNKYNGKKLGLSEKSEKVRKSEILGFLSYLINLNQLTVLEPMGDLSFHLPVNRLFFENNSGVVASRGVDNDSKYAGMLSIKDYSQYSHAGMFDHLFNIPVEMILTQSFSFLDGLVAKKTILERQRNMSQSDNSSEIQNELIDTVLDGLGHTSGVGEHHLSILCTENSIAKLDKSLAKIDNVLNQIGIIAVREDIGLKATFFAMLPGNNRYIVRSSILTSNNLAGYASLHNHSTGNKDNNYWGDAVTVLETESKTPYYFNFHVHDVGNTFLIGPMGSGKTLIESFLISESLKFGGRLIIFDKDRGMEIFVRALEGSYSILNSNRKSGFAPFQLEDTHENRYFLNSLLVKLASINGSNISENERDLITKAVDGAFQLPKEERILRNIVPFLGLAKGNSLRNRLQAWVGEGAYAWVFDNEVESLVLDNNVIGFDMTHILDDEVVRDPVYFYLFKRVESLLDGTKTRIVVAEGWKALQDDSFRKQIQDWSSTPRKKEAFLILDTQSPEDITKSQVGCKLIQESVTQIYFPNSSAKREHYVNQFGLNEKEFKIVKSLSKQSRYFLLKHGSESTVVRADLSFMKEEVAVLSTRTKNIKLMDQAISQCGNKSEDWLPQFYKSLDSLQRDNNSDE